MKTDYSWPNHHNTISKFAQDSRFESDSKAESRDPTCDVLTVIKQLTVKYQPTGVTVTKGNYIKNRY